MHRDSPPIDTEKLTFRHHENFISAIICSPFPQAFACGTILILSFNDNVWNVATGKQPSILRGHSMPITSIASNGANIFSVSLDGSLRCWSKDQQIVEPAIHAIVMTPSSVPPITGSSDKIVMSHRNDSLLSKDLKLVVLWPGGFMDTDGIKRAIYRAKDKRGLFSSQKDREKIKKKNAAPPKIDDAINVTKALHIHEKSSCSDSPTLARKPVVPSATGRNPVADFAKNGLKADKPKQEKAKRSPNGDNPIDAMPSNLLPRKKIKKKPNPKALDGQLRLENMDQWPKLH
ncbi:hypothetical protein PHJA_000738200 [Phtheirospermum japonicum]|uniref:Uncharacterized protein n=1 Tax=Phtheirospermum japonicum TaxID=374723 RepID=A0A830BN10_9LAMI|nr:hypothetical protein PHJA_000738200 [Phtheirospermum japonicum]